MGREADFKSATIRAAPSPGVPLGPFLYLKNHRFVPFRPRSRPLLPTSWSAKCRQNVGKRWSAMAALTNSPARDVRGRLAGRQRLLNAECQEMCGA